MNPILKQAKALQVTVSESRHNTMNVVDLHSGASTFLQANGYRERLEQCGFSQTLVDTFDAEIQPDGEIWVKRTSRMARRYS